MSLICSGDMVLLRYSASGWDKHTAKSERKKQFYVANTCESAAQQTFTCSKSSIETPTKAVKYVQS